MDSKKNTSGIWISISIMIIVLAAYIVYSLVTPFIHTTTYWLVFLFEVVAILYLLVNVIGLAKREGVKAKFFGLPLLYIAWAYFAGHTIFSIYTMYMDTCTIGLIPYNGTLITECIVAAAVYLLGVFSFFGSRAVESVDVHTAEKVSYISDIKTEVSLLESSDKKLSSKLEDVSEAIRFSDPMSHSDLEPLEIKIQNKVNVLKESIDDVGASIDLCDEILRLIKERNLKTKDLKGKPDTRRNTEPDKGTGEKALAFSLLAILVVATVVIVALFVLTPASKYNAADRLFNEKQYELALVGFRGLGSYRDSVERADEIEDMLYAHPYEWACQLYEMGQYDAAYIEFTALGDYRDSADKAWEVWMIIQTAQFEVEEPIVEEIPEEVIDERQRIIEALQLAFSNTEIEIDPETGDVILPSNFLFGNSSYEINPDCEVALRQVMTSYISVLLSDEFRDSISRIYINGYTDSLGSYDDNLELSYHRASSVAAFFLDEENGLTQEQIEDLEVMLSVNGRSSNDLIYVLDENGNPTDEVDNEASRRVEISFRLVGQ